MTRFEFDEKVDGHHDEAIAVLRRTLRKIDSVSLSLFSEKDAEDIINYCRVCTLALEAWYDR